MIRKIPEHCTNSQSPVQSLKGMMFSIKLNIVLFISFHGVVGNPRFRSDYTYHSAVSGWLKLHVVPLTWSDARQTCYIEGAALASPVNAAMHRALLSEMANMSKQCEGIFTGVNSIYSKGYFYSIEGVPVSKMGLQWMPGEPDNAFNKEDCVALTAGGAADVECSEVLPFVCYRGSTAGASVMPCGTVDRGYEFVAATGSCYKVHKNKAIWSEAFRVCSAEGGYLAIINSHKEASVLRDIYDNHYPNGSSRDVIQIGLHDWRKDRVFRTVHGETLEEAGYAAWNKGQPDNAGGEGQYCGGMFPDAKLDDFWCDRAANFVCEKNPDDLQDT